MNKGTGFRGRIWRWVLAVLGIIGLCVLAWTVIFREPAEQVQASVIGITLPDDAAGYTRAEGPQPLVFPRDHGPHPDFQTEWWYYTGNLETAEGRRFGYQLTFFRRAVTPPAEAQARDSSWGSNQVYMAHFTLTDVAEQQFYYAERFERGAAGLAGAQGEPAYVVWLRDWTVRQLAADEYQLTAKHEGMAIDLRMVDTKGPVLQGDQGYSRKGPEPGNASIYYSQTNLESTGTVTIAGTNYAVSGLSWLDREISTSVLSEGQVGWDWFALHLDDGSELMVFRLRRADGSADPYSAGLYVAADGSSRTLSGEDFEIVPKGTWRSPHSGGAYPAEFTVRVPSLELELEIQPQVADQELNVSFIYWEGSIQAAGSRAGRAITGLGYAELTGYAESFEGRF